MAGERDRPGARSATGRLIAAGAVAGGLGLITEVLDLAAGRAHAGRNLTCGGGPMGCLGLAIVGVVAAVLAIVVLAWPLLHAAGVRPAWPVALIGPVVAFALSREYVAVAGRPLQFGLVIVLAAGYATAAVITSPRLYRYWSAVAAVAVIALYVVVARTSPGL